MEKSNLFETRFDRLPSYKDTLKYFVEKYWYKNDWFEWDAEDKREICILYAYNLPTKELQDLQSEFAFEYFDTLTHLFITNHFCRDIKDDINDMTGCFEDFIMYRFRETIQEEIEIARQDYIDYLKFDYYNEDKLVNYDERRGA